MALIDLIRGLKIGAAVTIQLEEDEVEEGPCVMPTPGPVMPRLNNTPDIYPTLRVNVASEIRSLAIGETIAYTPITKKRHQQTNDIKRKNKLYRQKNKMKIKQKQKIWRKKNQPALKRRAKMRHLALGPIQPPKKKPKK